MLWERRLTRFVPLLVVYRRQLAAQHKTRGPRPLRPRRPRGRRRRRRCDDLRCAPLDRDLEIFFAQSGPPATLDALRVVAFSCCCSSCCCLTLTKILLEFVYF